MKFVYILIVIAALAASSFAQWTVTNLHPAGVDNSAVFAVTPTYQAGSARLYGPNQSAIIWHGSSSSYDDLNPTGSNNSKIRAAHGSMQGGFAVFSSVAHAALWYGTASSFVDLHPTGANSSSVTSIYGLEQGGGAQFGSSGHAVLWSGSAASMIDLHPDGASNSGLGGIAPGQQVGAYSVGTSYARAGIWAGSANSLVDLNGSLVASGAQGTDGLHQVGWGEITPSSRLHAILWSGTAASWIDLTPAGSDSAEAYGVTGNYQVGFTYFGITPFASFWSGSSQSWVNLHQFLPAGYRSSYAYSIVQSDNQLIVGGYAVNDAGTVAEAIMWVSPVPEPATIGVLAFGLALIARRSSTCISRLGVKRRC